jgi:hypothetical protein
MPNYVIVYLKRGAHVSSSPLSGDLAAAQRSAREGLIRRGADQCQIRSDTLDGPLIWQGRRDPNATAFGVDESFREE